MARAATTAELNYLRADGQASKLYLSFPQFATVWTAVVTGAYAADRVASITYTSASAAGAPAAGMTVRVGTTPGGSDVGRFRARGIPAGGTLAIGETSDLAFAAGQYLTMVDDYDLWIRPVTSSGSTAWMDYDIAYTDQHANCDPVPVLGPPAVAWLENGQATVTFDGRDSWCIGATITGYAWSASGSATISGSASATPTLTATVAEVLQVACTVTASNGRTATGYRPVIILDPNALADNATQFKLDTCSGDYAVGGWSLRVTLYAGADFTQIQDGAPVILHAQDWYGDTALCLGPVAGRENVVMWGRICADNLYWGPEYTSVTFDIRGPAFWLDKLTNFPAKLQDTTGIPADWLHFQELTADKFLWDLFHWRSTADAVLDIYPTHNTYRAESFQAPGSISLWQQLLTVVEISLLAHPCCDRYGRLFVEIDAQVVAEADRATFPVVQALTTDDWERSLEFGRQWLPQTALLDVSGVYWNGANPTCYFALAPGHVFKQHGKWERTENLLLPNAQSEVNGLAGRLLGRKNNPYPNVPVALAENNRLVDICPRQYVTITLAADNARGEVWTAKKFLPRTVSLEYDPATLMLRTALTLEGETFTQPAITGDAPQSPPAKPAPPEIDFPLSPRDPADGIGGTDLVYVLTDANFARTRTFTAGSAGAGPQWEDLTGILNGALSDGCLDPYAPKTNAVVVGASGFWLTAGNSLDGTPSWLCRQTKAQFEAANAGQTLDTFQSVRATIAAPGAYYVLAVSHAGATYYAYVGHTADYGMTWTWTQLGATTNATDVHGFAVSQHNAGTVLASAGAGLLYKSTDGGVTFSNPYSVTTMYPIANIEIPYEGNGGDALVIIGGKGSASANYYLYSYDVGSGNLGNPDGALGTAFGQACTAIPQRGIYSFESPLTYTSGDWEAWCNEDDTSGASTAFVWDATTSEWYMIWNRNHWDCPQHMTASDQTKPYWQYFYPLIPGHVYTKLYFFCIVGPAGAFDGLKKFYIPGETTSALNYIQKSTDGAASFSDITPASGGGAIGWRGLHSDVLDSDHLTALVGSDPASLELWETLDGGASWSQLHPAALTSPVALGRWPYNADTLYLLQAGSVNASGDNGATLGDQTGDFAAAVGALAKPRNIIPVWIS